MTNLFLPVLKMSAVGSIVILAVILVRFLLRGAPKIYSYLLWSIVAFRLLCPVALTSNISIFNYVKGTPAVSGTEEVTSVIAEQRNDPMSVISFFWISGIVILVIYSIVTYYRLKIRLKGAEHMYDNIYCADRLPSPFVMGFLSPVIYIPTGLADEEREYVLKHERVHIKRCDHIVKLFAFSVLALHWFNPFCWVAFMLMSRDMEMSCDERVLRDGSSIKIYGNALISMATVTRFPSPGPISFGEVGVKRRVKNILRWKKPAIWITVISVILCIGTVSIFATDAKKETPELPKEESISVEAMSDTSDIPDTSDTSEVQSTDTTTADTTTADTTTVDTTTADTTTVDTTTADTTAHSSQTPAVTTAKKSTEPATSDDGWSFEIPKPETLETTTFDGEDVAREIIKKRFN